MQPTKHEHADLIKEYARQMADGELQAGWWGWEYYNEDTENWEKAPSPLWTSSIKYRFTKSKNHPDFNLYISPGDSFEIGHYRKTIVTMHLAGNLHKVCFTDQTGRYFIGIFDIEKFGQGFEAKVPMSVIEQWLHVEIIKETIVRCSREYN